MQTSDWLKADLRLADALAMIRNHLPIVRDREEVRLVESRGRVLAEALAANVDLPGSDFSTMDGFAVRSADVVQNKVTVLNIVGRAAAGAPFDGFVGDGEAIRVLTGAAMPTGANAVIMQEQCIVDGSQLYVRPGTLKTKSNWRRRGEEAKAGSELLPAGHRLRAQDLALAGGIGVQHLTVFRRIKVGLFSTGSELCEAGQTLRQGKRWDANRFLLHGALTSLACEVHDHGILSDDALEIEGALSAAARDCDLLITTGGMSAGSEDHMRTVIRRRGSLEVWPLAIKPGRPVGLGDIDDCPILALPGNPIAATIAFIAFGRPLVSMLAGAGDEHPLTFPMEASFMLNKPKGIRQYILADTVNNASGSLVAVPWPRQSPDLLLPLVGARGLIILPEDCTAVGPGDLVKFVPIESILQ